MPWHLTQLERLERSPALMPAEPSAAPPS
jgi:hypothetical protein